MMTPATIFISVVLAGILCGISAPAQAIDPPESQVTAAMLFNITKFVEWPSDSFAANSQLSICIAGTNPFNSSSYTYQDKISKGKTIKIRSISGPQEVQGCHLLFIDQTEQAAMPAYLQQTSGLPILTASNIVQFASNHGIIGLFRQDDRLRFEINHDEARRSRLMISSNLLKLARIVR
jgi:hypothetical protein